jgi:plastocyanin
MKKLFHIGLALSMFLGMFSFALPVYASTAQSYTVLVGAENTSTGVSLMDYFPQILRIHVGDTITWKINSHEIHTVTFLAGQPLQPFIIPAPSGMASPLQLNPQAVFPAVPAKGLYDGSTYVNSGILSSDPGFAQALKLTFTHEGVFQFLCYVHGQMMSGTVEVVGSGIKVPTPAQVQLQAQAELGAAWAKVPAVLAQAKAQIVPPVKNQDGTLTHTVIMGYESMDVMVMGFFPSKITVRKGDSIVWKLSSSDTEAPHTITFYNGTPDQPLVVMAQGPSGPVALINPAVLFPSQAVLQGKSLNQTDFFNSGILNPGGQTSFSIKVGNVSSTLNYECILHDTSGMTGKVYVISTSGN